MAKQKTEDLTKTVVVDDDTPIHLGEGKQFKGARVGGGEGESRIDGDVEGGLGRTFRK
ncbi:hypothetical protein ABZ769_31995 [Streptomyces olivoreticuli]